LRRYHDKYREQLGILKLIEDENCLKICYTLDLQIKELQDRFQQISLSEAQDEKIRKAKIPVGVNKQQADELFNEIKAIKRKYVDDFKLIIAHDNELPDATPR